MGRKGRKLDLIMGLMVVCLFICILQTRVKAANTSDSAWKFTLSVQDASYKYVGQRAKENDSYVYLKWSEKTGTLSALNARVLGDGADCGTPVVGVEHTYYVWALGQYSIVNYVNENKRTKCNLGLRSNAGYGDAIGLWSPDSVGTYTVIY